MEKFIINQWEERKHLLRKWLEENKQDEFSEYVDIVKALFRLVITEANEYGSKFNVENITILDHGSYQGTLVFIIPRDTYQPSVEDYIYTDTYYGSCSGCDTLQSICSYNYNEKPSAEQVNEYMTLALHLVQKLKWMKE